MSNQRVPDESFITRKDVIPLIGLVGAWGLYEWIVRPFTQGITPSWIMEWEVTLVLTIAGLTVGHLALVGWTNKRAKILPHFFRWHPCFGWSSLGCLLILHFFPPNWWKIDSAILWLYETVLMQLSSIGLLFIFMLLEISMKKVAKKLTADKEEQTLAEHPGGEPYVRLLRPYDERGHHPQAG